MPKPAQNTVNTRTAALKRGKTTSTKKTAAARTTSRTLVDPWRCPVAGERYVGVKDGVRTHYVVAETPVKQSFTRMSRVTFYIVNKNDDRRATMRSTRIRWSDFLTVNKGRLVTLDAASVTGA